MNLDDRLRSAHRYELDEARRSFEADRGRTRFEASAGRRGAGILAAAAVLIAIVGVVTVTNQRDGSSVRLDTSTTVPFADQAPQTGAGFSVDDDDADQQDEGREDDAVGDQVEVGDAGVDAAIPTPTPSPTVTPTPEDGASSGSAAGSRGDRAVAPPTPTSIAPTPEAPPSSSDPTPPPTGVASDETQAEQDESAGAATPTITPAATSESAPTATVAPSSTPEPTATARPTTTAPPATATVVPSSTPAPTSTALPTATPVPTATPEPTSTPTPTATAVPTPTPEPRDVGIATQVCPAGRRAQLESSSLSYVSATTGWGRLYDLVDEQDGPYYFMAWEPGYSEPVTVEVVLSEPALAADIRVHQDPFTPVAGTIDIDVSGLAVQIELSGTDGWRVHEFGTATLIERFTITRDAFEENVMEVMICLSP